MIDPQYKNELITRIQKVDSSAKAQWGKMNVNEMICHVADQIRMAIGIKPTEFVGNKLTTTLLKMLVLTILPMPKGKAETVKELKQGVGGTKPTNFETDKQTLINLLQEFDKSFNETKIIVHPIFGKLNYKQWGRMVYVHTDHHLRQFGK